MKTKFGLPEGLTYEFAKPMDYVMLIIATLGFIISTGSFIYYVYPVLTPSEDQVYKEPELMDLGLMILAIAFCYEMVWGIKYIQLCIPKEDDDD